MKRLLKMTKYYQGATAVILATVMFLSVFLFFYIPANATDAVRKQKPVQCATPDKILNHYVESYNFTATFVGVSNIQNQHGANQPAGIVFFMNPETKTFLILEGNAEYACVLSIGNNLDFDITHQEIMNILLGGGT